MSSSCSVSAGGAVLCTHMCPTDNVCVVAACMPMLPPCCRLTCWISSVALLSAFGWLASRYECWYERCLTAEEESGEREGIDDNSSSHQLPLSFPFFLPYFSLPPCLLAVNTQQRMKFHTWWHKRCCCTPKSQIIAGALAGNWSRGFVLGPSRPFLWRGRVHDRSVPPE